MRQRALRGQRWHLVDERSLDRERTPTACPDCGSRELTVQEVFGGSGYLVETPVDVEFCRRAHGAEVDVGDVLCWSGSTVSCPNCDWELETAAALHREREEESRQRQCLVLEEALAVAEAQLAENGDAKTLAQIAVLRLGGGGSPPAGSTSEPG
jgi:hypothetical protein